MVRQEKARKSSKLKTEQAKFSLFAVIPILYIGNPTYFTKKLFEFINKFSKVVQYKINTHTNQMCF
jgi:hypothetical protein